MNDISDNVYLKRRYTALSDFTLYDYLFNDIELEREANCDEVQVAISKLLATHGFKINLLGFKFLVALITRYIVNSDYNENKEIESIACIYGTIPRIVRDSINASISYNRIFLKYASKSLGYAINFSEMIKIHNVVEIIGALFKINYNYILCDEVAQSNNRTVNFVRMTLNNG